MKEPTYEDYTEERTQEQAEETRRGNMSLISHLEELRARLIRSLIAVGVCSVGCYFYAEEIVHLITKPAGKLYYMQPAEAFFTYMKVSFVAGFLVALPVVLYHVWKFLLPALTSRERAAVGSIVPFSVFLFYLGLTFSYFFVLPAGIQFFLGFASDDLQPMFSVGRYLDFVVAFVLPFGFVFELPLILMVLAKIGIVTSDFLRKKRKIVIFLSFVVGAVISPTPDIFSQTMIAVPMLGLYEISIFIIKVLLKK